MAELEESKLRSPNQSIYLAYAMMEAELAQKKEVIRGLYNEISRANAFTDHPALATTIDNLTAMLAARDQRILHLNNEITVIKAELGKVIPK